MNITNTLDDQVNPLTIKKDLNIFKYLFWIILILFLIILSLFIIVFINQKNISSSKETIEISPSPTVFTENESIIESKPTLVVDQKNESIVKVYTKDDGKNINLILKKGNKEIVVDHFSKDRESAFSNITLTPSLNYLKYVIQGKTEHSIRIYNIQKEIFVKNQNNSDIFYSQGNSILDITDDEKFLIYCSGGGYGGLDGAIIFSLPENTIKFDFAKYLGDKLGSPSVACSPNVFNNTVELYYYKDVYEKQRTSVIYNLDTGSIKEN